MDGLFRVVAGRYGGAGLFELPVGRGALFAMEKYKRRGSSPQVDDAV